jgi:hypothetical protein
MRMLLSAIVAAILLSPCIGCGGDSDMTGPPKEPTTGPPPAAPGMDLMKDKMEKKKR